MSYSGLSKSKIAAFEQCPRKLWLSVHRPELALPDPGAEARFTAGHEVGAAACQLYPAGVMIEAQYGLSRAAEDTARLLTDGWDRPIFEATFSHDNVLVRVDLMLPASAGQWHVAEVKSSTGLKDYHLGDLATQIWVLENAGVQVVSANVRHLDSTFRLTREGDYTGLFADTRVDETIRPIVTGRPATVAAARAVLNGGEPVRDMGGHCNAPFVCEFQHWCGKNRPAPPTWPATILPDATGKKIAREWAARGVDDLLAIPADAMPNAKLARVHAATLSAEAFHDPDGFRTATADWEYPRHYLDFETIAFPVPRWIGTGPWEQVPFQFSCHTEHANGRIDHVEFLSIDGTDPREACAQALIACFSGDTGMQGTVIAYNAGFERRVLRKLVEAVPAYAEALRAIEARVVDLLPPTRAYYYHRDQRGSWSIKAVLPTIAADLAYDGLVEVKAGDEAQAAYLEAIDSATQLSRKNAIRAALLSYCKRDTEAMVRLMTSLSNAGTK